MGSIFKFLKSLTSLAKNKNITIDEAYKFAKQEFGEVNDLLKLQINKIFKDPNLKIMGMWGNISSFSNFNWPHSHSSDKLTQMISGVLYLQVPKNSGDIVFCSPYDVNIQVFKHTPIEKEIILFPANTQHLVYPNESNEDRLSIAFNISL